MIEEASNDDEEAKEEQLNDETSNDDVRSSLHIVLAQITFLRHNSCT